MLQKDRTNTLRKIISKEINVKKKHVSLSLFVEAASADEKGGEHLSSLSVVSLLGYQRKRSADVTKSVYMPPFKRPRDKTRHTKISCASAIFL